MDKRKNVGNKMTCVLWVRVKTIFIWCCDYQIFLLNGK